MHRLRIFKKQKLEQANRFSTGQSRIDDNELSTSDTGNAGDTDADTEADRDEKGTWFWNKSASESESNSECSGDSEERDLAPEESRTEQEAPSQKQPKEIKWNKQGEENLRGVYGQGSVATFYRKKKAAIKWEEEGRKSYNIQALWQRNRDWGLIFNATIQSEPSETSDPSSYSLNKVPPGYEISRSKQEIDKEKRTTALKDITRLLELVTVQEEKYGERSSPHGNFHRRHMMVQQFLQIQLRSKTRQRRRDFTLSIARSFGKGYGTARNIVRWENSWVEKREIPG